MFSLYLMNTLDIGPFSLILNKLIVAQQDNFHDIFNVHSLYTVIFKNTKLFISQ